MYRNTDRMLDKALASSRKTVNKLRQVVSLNDKDVVVNEQKKQKLETKNEHLKKQAERASRIATKLEELFELSEE